MEYIRDVLLEVYKDLNNMIKYVGGCITVNEEHGIFNFNYKKNPLEKRGQTVLVLNSEGILVIDTKAIPLEAQMEFIKLVAELEESFVMSRLEELDAVEWFLKMEEDAKRRKENEKVSMKISNPSEEVLKSLNVQRAWYR